MRGRAQGAAEPGGGVVRRISFALTPEQIRDRSKTVTRRTGWAGLKPGDRLLATSHMLGGDPLCEIEVVSVREEPARAITDDDVDREGFPGKGAAWFLAMLERELGVKPEDTVRRIEFRYPGAAS